jgi:DNA-directed RNA polymerase subunit RPC12/RpoP
MSSKFRKNKEDFVCENCSREVVGDGFTNHCPKCLYSKHVDVFPGDRALLRSKFAKATADGQGIAQTCEGMMKLIGAEESGGEWSIIHKCSKCGAERKNKISKEDNFDLIVKISAKDHGFE